jgi:hypothetical protein
MTVNIILRKLLDELEKWNISNYALMINIALVLPD